MRKLSRRNLLATSLATATAAAVTTKASAQSRERLSIDKAIAKIRKSKLLSNARIGDLAALRTLRTITESRCVRMRRCDSVWGDSGSRRTGVRRLHDRRGSHSVSLGHCRLQAR